MRIAVCAIGRMRSRHERALFEAYLDRAEALGRQLGISAIRLSEIEARQDRQREAAALLAAIPEGAVLVSLDAGGRQYDSQDFAAWLETEKDTGTRDLAFAIGGAAGHGEGLHRAADRTLSLGVMTWPHMLARIMLMEQIYRAMAILAHHPYHRA